MKLTLLTPYPAAGGEPRGGVETAASRLVPALERHGVDVRVIGVRAGPDAGADGSGGVWLRSDERFSLLRGLAPMRRRLASVLRADDSDLVHALGLVPAGYAATHVDRGARPCVITAHGSRRQDTLAAYGGAGARVRWLLGRRMVRSAIAKADALIGVHPDWQVNLTSRPLRFVYIPNIVDDRFFAASRRPTPARVLYCGGEASIKGWDLLRAAWPRVLRQVAGARLHAIGVASASVPQAFHASVDTSPWLSPEQLAAAMTEAAVVVIPSRFEVAPTVLSEAWAARVPVVATAVGGVPVLARGAALLVEELNPGGLGDALIRAIEGPETELVAEGARRAELQREDAVAEAHLAVYRSLLAG